MKIFTKKIFLFLILALVAGIAFVGFYKPEIITVFFQEVEYSRSLYKQARDLQRNNDYKAAYYTYSRISPQYKAYDVVLFQQANCAAAVEDEKTAIEKYEKILNTYPESKLAPLSSYNLGQAYLRSKQPIEAEKQFLYTLNNYPGTDFALGSFYYLGELNKNKNKELAIQYWLKYMAIAPSGRFAINSYEGINSLNYQFNQQDKKHAAIVMFMQQKYKESLKLLSQLPEKEVWYYKALSYKALGNKEKALSLLREAFKNYLDESVSRSKIEKAMFTYVELSSDRKYKSWTDILRWTDKANDFALYQKASLLPMKKAKKIYEEIYVNYPYGNFASESLWNVFWLEYDSGNYDKALELAHKHISSFENTKASPAIRFWMGKIYELKNDKAKAAKFYKTVKARFPDSYYAFRATGRLNALNGKQDFKWNTNINNRLDVEDLKVNIPYNYNEISEKHGVQAAEMVLTGDYETALLFISDNPFLESWIKSTKGIVTNSIVMARNTMNSILNRPSARDPKWKLIYPVYYPEEINNNASLNKLDPMIVISLLKEESHFNPYAVSSSNAQGLMQVLPCTAKDIIQWKNLGNDCNNKLFTPEVNIKVGTAYLGHTRDIFNGNMLFAVAAYNAGPGAVQTWVKRYSQEDLDRFIENIPYDQTKNYVKKVFGSYWNYKRVYGANSYS